MTPNKTIENDSIYLANARRRVCPTCGRDTWDRVSLPCKECPCRNCGGAVDRSRILHKKDCSVACKKAFEKEERTLAMRMFREANQAIVKKNIA